MSEEGGLFLEVFNQMIEMGADPAAQDLDGESVLHKACVYGLFLSFSFLFSSFLFFSFLSFPFLFIQFLPPNRL